MAKARLETVITGDDAPFVQAVNRAERRAQSFSGKLQGLFRRTPEARAERALTGFLGNIATGNISGAIGGITSKIHGFGLAAGIGIGVAVETFIKAKHQIDEVDKSVNRLTADLSKPLAVESALGSEGISKAVGVLQKELDDVVEKRKGFFQKIREAGQKGQPDVGYIDPKSRRWVSEETDSTRVPAAAKAQVEAFKRIHDLRRAQVNSEKDLVDLRETSLTASEREAEIAKISFERDQKVAALRSESGGDPREIANLHARILTINKDAKLSTDEASRKAGAKERELALEEAIAKIKSLSLPKDRESLAVAEARLKSLKQQQAGETQQERIRALTPKILEAENDVRDQRFAQFEKSPAQLQRERTIQEQHERELKKFDRQGGLHQPHFDMSGRLIGGIDPATGKQVDVSQPGLLDDLGKHMASPGQMSAFGGSDSFNQFFHPNDAKAASGPQDQKSKDDSNIGDVVDVLEDLGSKMDQYWGEN